MMLTLNAEWAEAPPVSVFFSTSTQLNPFCAAYAAAVVPP